MIDERSEKTNILLYVLLLIMTTILWGVGFVVTEQVLSDNVPVFMLLAIQFAVGALCLLAGFFVKRGKRTAPTGREALSGLLLGLLLGVALVLKYFGLNSYSQGTDKSYFFSSVFVLLVPVVTCIFDKKFYLKNLIDGLIALTGLAIFYNIFRVTTFFSLFDGLSLAGGIAFAFYFVLLGRNAAKYDTVRYAFYQLLSVAVVCSAFSLIFEMKYISEIKNVGGVTLGLLFLGVLCTGMAYCLLVLVQKKIPAATAALTVGGQSLFAFLFNWALGYSMLDRFGIVVGAVIVAVAILSSLLVRPQKFYGVFCAVFGKKAVPTEKDDIETNEGLTTESDG